MKDLQVTLYDIFGYLLPGFVFLAGIAILIGAIFMPSSPISLSTTAIDNWIVIVIGAYIAGHMVQAIANIITKKLPSAESLILEKGHPESFPGDVIDLVESEVRSTLGIKSKTMKPGFIYQVCDEAVLQFGVTSDRDIYIYREGFYRGLTVSFMVLVLGLTVRVLIPGASLNVSEKVQPLSTLLLLFFDALSLLAAWLSFNRYKRFGGYRVRGALIGFLLLGNKKIPAKTK